MSAEQDELRRLIEELPDERVPAVLVEAEATWRYLRHRLGGLLHEYQQVA